MEKIKQYLLGWGIPGFGVSTTIGLVVQGNIPLACLSGGATVVYWVVRWSAKFWQKFKQKLEERLERRFDEWADLALNQLEAELVRLWWAVTANCQGKYYTHITEKYRTYRTQGLKTQPLFKPDLEKAFVPLRIAPESLERISPDLIQERTDGKPLQIWNFLASSDHQAYKRMAIVAPPGAGKTTLLEHIALCYAQGQERRQHRQAPRLIPIVLYLREICGDIASETPPNLAGLVTQQQKKNDLEPLDWFNQKLKAGQCLVMLDGLDEVADEKQRQQVSQWVDQQITAYPKSWFIVSSRPYGYRSAPLEKIATILEVQPFSLTEVNQFLQKWYLQIEAMRQVRKVDRGVRRDAQTKADDLFGRIKGSPAIAAMALNPLLLTMIATVHDNRGALPGRRVELYAEICDVLLGRRQDAKKLKNPLTASQNQTVLQVLAEVVGQTLNASTYIKTIANLSGLLVEKERGLYEFAHKSFQEYLAAAQVAADRQISLLTERLGEVWWEETIRLYAAQGDATPLIQAALDYYGYLDKY